MLPSSPTRRIMTPSCHIIRSLAFRHLIGIGVNGYESTGQLTAGANVRHIVSFRNSPLAVNRVLCAARGERRRATQLGRIDVFAIFPRDAGGGCAGLSSPVPVARPPGQVTSSLSLMVPPCCRDATLAIRRGDRRVLADVLTTMRCRRCRAKLAAALLTNARDPSDIPAWQTRESAKGRLQLVLGLSRAGR
jgi:hypothetical protein